MDLDKLLQLMIQKNGSDLFITADAPISMKVNGTIAPVTKSALTPRAINDAGQKRDDACSKQRV